MNAAEILFLIVYFGVMAIGALYGSHRYRMAFLYYRHKFQLPTPNGRLEKLPHVTIQLPVFNEEYVVERLITSVCRIDYPKDLLEVQVLDDSTDETCAIAHACVERMRAQGHDVVYIHRDDRTGFKAGALEHGLKLAKGEFVAVFDADFVPAPDFLQRTVPFFADKKIGMVQVRWGHLNREYSALTQAQSILLDAHFMIEHTARNRSGCFFNFNGTAGIWRRDAITDAGGWQHDTLTEDLDLSYRAQLKGWQFMFLPEVVSPAEVPVDMNAFKTQQHRWAKGSIQTARKLLPTILKADLPFKVKREAFFHLTNNMAYLVVIVVALLMPLSMIVRFQHGLYATLWLDFPFFVAATLSVTAFYVAAQREMGVTGWARLKFLPFLMALGVGMAINNTKAVVEALFKMESGFARTPKTGAEGKNSRQVKTSYRGRASWMPYVELALGAYYSVSIYFAYDMGVMATVPFLILFQFGFLYVGVKSLWQGSGAGQATSAAPANDEQPEADAA